MKAAAVFALACAVTAGAGATQLKQSTQRAFETYLRAADSQVASRRAQGQFLWSQGRPEVDTAALRRGAIFVEKLDACESGRQVVVPDGMVHHWMGVVFIPGASVDSVLHVVQDYANHKNVYQPEVIGSRLISHEGNRYVAYMRMLKKKVITVVLDTVHDATYTRVSATRATSRSYTVKVQEVENFGKADERQLPPGDDRGLLWHISTWWTFEQKDGGVYVESESVSLSRDVPFRLGAVMKPFLESVPRESLCHTLTSTRRAVLGQPATAADDGAVECNVATPAGGAGPCR